MNEPPRSLKDLFFAALDIAPEARAAWLDQECPDPARRRHLKLMLDAHDAPQNLLDRPSLVLSPSSQSERDRMSPTIDAEFVSPGTSIGPYKLLESIGEGGMGSVWKAQQTEPIKRLVAVKLIKAGMDSRRVLSRFDAERQALALMDHPNIATVLDAGATAEGRPFFVMELVKGIPITKYCDEHHLTPRQRLDLFVPVCQAIQHAHQKGIIHRDIKPSNVLVAMYDDRPVPKVIDFGVAKATGQQLTEQTLHTGFGAVVGTLEYMSPEQASFNQLDVDTRSDIYSLGVLLYELLAGSPPFTTKDLEQAGMLEMLRVIREQAPSKPSTKLSSSDALPMLSANRGTEPKRLTKLVRGELDWIVMKSLEKDRSRRYETANGFAMDVQRYLADEAVQACPPSFGYRLRKLMRRNKGPVLAASLVGLALVAGIIGTTIGLLRAEHRAEGERQAKDTAEKRLAQIEKGIDLLGSIFEDLDPFAEDKEGRPLRSILGDRLDHAAVALEGEAIGDPLVVARLQDRLGQTYLGLGHAAKAEAQFNKALAVRLADLGPDHPLTLASGHNLALAYEARGKRIEAVKQFEQILENRVKVLGADHLDTLSTQHELAVAYHRSGKPIEAIPLLEQVRDGRLKHLGEDHHLTLAAFQSLAHAFSSARRHPEAIALAEKVRDARLKKHGDDHPRAIDAMAQLASVYQAGYRMRDALELYEKAEKTIVPKLGRYHPHTLRILSRLGSIYRAFRKTPEAIGVLDQALERMLMVHGAHHPATIRTQWDLALAQLDAKEPSKALVLLQRAAASVEKLEFAHDLSQQIVLNLAMCHEHFHQFAQAEEWHRKWMKVAKLKYGPESTAYAGDVGLAGLGRNLVQQSRFADAEPILRECLAILQKIEPVVWETFRTQSRFGGALLGMQNYAEAEPHLVQGYHGLKEREKKRGTRLYGSTAEQDLAEALDRLVQLYNAWGKPEQATKWRTELETQRKSAEKSAKPNDK